MGEIPRCTKMARKRQTSVHDLTDNLLELVFLALDSPARLVHAASTCKRWHDVIADGAFLRRFRSLHEPKVIGHYYYTCYTDPPYSFGKWRCLIYPKDEPVFVPILIGAAKFTLGFLPLSGTSVSRLIVDSRGSLLLFLNLNKRVGDEDSMIPDLVVCEPVTGQYKRIRPPWGPVCIIGAFLVDTGEIEAGGGISITNFQVIIVLYWTYHDTDRQCGRGYPVAGVCARSRKDGDRYSVNHNSDDRVYLPRFEGVHFAGRTGGCIYWGCEDKQVIVLNERTLKFSNVSLPDHMKMKFHSNNFRVLGGDGGAVRIIRLTDGGDLQVFSQLRGCCTGNWVLDRSIRLAEATLRLPGYREEYFAKLPEIIRVHDRVVVLSPEKTWLFCLDIDTMELERDHRKDKHSGVRYPLTQPWPPVLRACVDNKVGANKTGESVMTIETAGSKCKRQKRRRDNVV